MTAYINIDAQLDTQLRNRLRDAVAHDATPRWGDVKRRAGVLERRRRRPRLVLGLAVAAVIIAAPAFAIAAGVIDFSSAPSAPEPVRVLFNQLSTMSGPNFPTPIVGQTRLVYTFHTADKSYALAVAPAQGGGWCWVIVGREGTCSAQSTGLNFGYNAPPPVGDEPLLIDGSIAAADVTRIAIKFEDGSSINLPFVQVSPPINADFFLYEIGPGHWNVGTRPSTIAAYNADGIVVGSGWFLREADMPVVGGKG